MQKVTTIFFFLMLGINLANAQNLDSLFQLYASSHGNIKGKNNITAHIDPLKCGLPVKAVLLSRFDELTSEQQSILNTTLDRPEKQTSIVSPSGIFRIHYDVTGPDAPNYFPNEGLAPSEAVQKSVDSLAAAFDYAYNYETSTLPYDPPVSDNGEGGDDLYDIYIKNSNFYGETKFVSGSPESYIEIENDFVGGFATEGIHAAKATAAHEFHHAIQISSFGFYGSETMFYELTSTAMEEFVYDDVNDYYAYMPSYFRSPYKSFKEYNGYDLACFYLYLQQKNAKEGNDLKGHEIIARAWELLGQNGRAVESISISLFEHGSSWAEAWNEFGIWCWFTGGRPATQTYFEESENYPQLRPLASYNFTTGTKEYMLNTKPISNNYLLFEINSGNIKDSLVAIITNADVDNAVSSPYTTTDITYLISTNSSSGSKIVNEYYSSISAPNVTLFKQGNIFNNQPVSGNTIDREVVDYTFPQPFIYSVHNSLFIPSEPNTLEFADLNIYTTSMDLVYNGRERILLGDKIVVRWDALDNDGNKLPTGIYIYVTKSDDNIRKGKFVIYND